MSKFGDKWFGVKPPDPTSAIPKFDKHARGFAVKSKSGRVLKRFKSRADAEHKKKTLEENNPDSNYTIEEIDWNSTVGKDEDQPKGKLNPGI